MECRDYIDVGWDVERGMGEFENRDRDMWW